MKPFFLSLFLAVTLSFLGCNTSWTKVIQYGEVDQDQFKEKVDITIKNCLIFLPVTIDGKQYNFLFDSGAPLSISKELQAAFNFKVLSKGNIVDSDNNRTKVEWCQLETLNVGGVTFKDQTAFVGDFKANPVLACLEIDGILGSNLLRQCNWEIDQKDLSVTFFKNAAHKLPDGALEIPFTSNQQFSMFIDLEIGRATIRNVLVDFGSNGSISLGDKAFSDLENVEIIGDVIIEKGEKQSGIVGKAVDITRRIVYTDSVSTRGILSKNVMLRTGKKASIGNGFMSRFQVRINWDKEILYLTPIEEDSTPKTYSGFAIGCSRENGMHVRSIIEGSNAHIAGVRPGMKVMRVDGLDFENEDDFCDYVDHKLSQKIFLDLTDSKGNRKEYRFEKTTR